jgi:hypothetical protein
MRKVLILAGSALVVSSGFALAAPVRDMLPIDGYAFAGGPDAIATAPLEAGRSAAIDNAAPRAFTSGDVNHAFATWGFAD